MSIIIINPLAILLNTVHAWNFRRLPAPTVPDRAAAVAKLVADAEAATATSATEPEPGD